MINDIHIFNDIISKEKQDILESYFLDKDLKWKTENNTNYLKLPFPQKVIKSEDRIEESVRNIILEIEKNTVKKLNTSILENYRYKINFLSSEYYSENRNEMDGIHIDTIRPHVSMVYYVNDSEGDTVFYQLEGKNEDIIEYLSKKEYNRFKKYKSVSPNKGKVVVFNGLTPHHSTYPKNGNRFVINFNTVIKTNPKILF
jgi:hypothetical protein